LMQAHSPPCSRRGGRAIKKMGPVPLIGAAGVVCSTSRSHLIDSREALLMNSVRYASIYKEFSRHLQTTPAAPANEASRDLLDGRSHPSLTKQWHSLYFERKSFLPSRERKALIWSHVIDGAEEFLIFRLTFQRVLGKVHCDELCRGLAENDV